MKKTQFVLVLAVLAGFLTACGHKGASNKNAQSEIALPPALQTVYKQQLQQQVDAEIKKDLSLATDSMVTEAADVVAESSKAISSLANNDYKAATDAVERAIGKAEKIVAVKPGLSMVPLDVKLNVNDLVADPATLENLQDQVKELSDKGYLQDVRRLMNGISSEVTITTSNLPLASYPDALKAAAKLIQDKKGAEAAVVLSDALNTIVIEKRSIPLPIIRAEGMLKAAAKLLSQKNRKDDKDVIALLDNADYQIHFAEELGYGKKDKEFDELYSSVKDLKAEVRKKERSAQIDGLMNTLESKLNTFKTKISQKAEHK
jgi:hypothetical protein